MKVELPNHLKGMKVGDKVKIILLSQGQNHDSKREEVVNKMLFEVIMIKKEVIVLDFTDYLTELFPEGVPGYSQDPNRIFLDIPHKRVRLQDFSKNI